MPFAHDSSAAIAPDRDEGAKDEGFISVITMSKC